MLTAFAGLVPLYLASLAVVALVPAGETGSDAARHQGGQLGLSGLWASTGIALLLAGLRRNQRELRLGALTLLGVSIAKVFLYDLATLTSVWRIASFLALGLVLLAAAYAYQRLRPALAETGA